MTAEQWAAEVLDALAGSRWRAFYTRVAQDSSACYAHLVHEDGHESSVQLPCEQFGDASARAAEIRRLLGIAVAE